MTQELDLSVLKGLERQVVLDVLNRDQMLRKVDEERIRKLKLQLQELRWKGTKNTNLEYKSCARCQKPLGVLINRGAVCNGCSHQVCSRCRITLNRYLWKCTVCYAHEELKVKAGEWFFEQRSKKFPVEGRYETAGAKLLDSYQALLSNISVVPPTPPPFAESTSEHNTVELDQTKSFHRSMENLFLTFTSHIKKISKSQNDMTAEKGLLTTDYGQAMDPKKERRSLSDTAIDISSRVNDAPSLQQLVSEDQGVNGVAAKRKSSEELIPSSAISDLFSSGKLSGSLFSINSTCTEAGNFEQADVSGEIEVAIRYLFKSGILEVYIRACKNLAYGEEKKKKCNPYIKTRLLPDKSSQSKRKTSVKKNTLDPTFQETLKYKIEYSQLETRQLQISVWHAGTFRHRVFLGEVVIPFESWDFEDSSTQSFSWYQLKAKPEKPGDNVLQYSGELLLRAKLDSPSLCNKFQYGMEDRAHPEYQLQLLVLGARNLPMLRPDGLLNAFVKGCLCILGQRDLKQRTPVLKKQAQPQWNHLFVFNGVTASQLQQSCLDLTVWDQASFGLRDQFLGGARLGKQTSTGTVDATSQACLQWEKMLSSPDTWTDIALSLYPNAPAFKF
ncbi:synaptotagmin 3 isoform X1 [Podarcis lilfordi]|uniref:Synaptotagmin 3 isoform X1 n=1 Tax=Podarcis lilfordi TaxID=74358 RepID=A0AA35K3P4_9SAUR|nr:synaptotagmin 3 isoform X1 [Podarcis lilfordi]